MQFKSLVVAGATAAAMSAWFAAPALATVPTVAFSNGAGFCGEHDSEFFHHTREHEDHEPRFWHFNNEEHEHHNNNNNGDEPEFHHQHNHFFDEQPFNQHHEHQFFHFFHQGPCFF